MQEQIERIRNLFDQAISAPPSELPRRLTAAAPDDADLRSDVLALLRHAHAAEQPISAVSGESVLDPNIGKSIGAFRLSCLIGHGGTGNVYLGERADGFKQQVAVKLVRRSIETDELLRPFRLARQVLAQLNHANVARLIGGGECGSPAAQTPFAAVRPVNSEDQNG